MIKNLLCLKNIFFIVTFCIITFSIAFILRYDVISGDDIALGFFRTYTFGEISGCDHARYLSIIQQRFVSTIAYLFNIHPNSLANTLGALIRGFDIALMCFILSMFLYKERERTIYTPILMFVIFIFYIQQIFTHTHDEIFYFNFHFGYLFGTILYFTFLYMVGYILLKKDNLSFFNLIILSIIAFLTSINDTFAITGIIFIVLITSILFISYLFQKNDNSNIFIKFLKNNKKILFIFIIYSIGAILSIRGMLNSNIANFIDNNQNSSFFIYWFVMLKKFIPQYANEIIVRHWQSLTTILILFILIVKSNIENKKQYLAYALCILLSVHLFMFSLISGGTDTFYEKGKFWISHNDLQLFYNMTLILICLYLFGIYYNYIKDNKKLFYTVTIIALILVGISLKDFKSTFDFVIRNYKEEKEARVSAYKAEKMYLFYCYNNLQPILPVSVLSHSKIGSAYWVGIQSDGNIFSEYEIIENNNDEKIKEIIDKIKQIDFTGVAYYTNYIPSIYKLKETELKPYKFVEDDIAYEYFYNSGGIFTEKEIKNTNYNNLLNKDFVLNKVDYNEL